MTSVYRAPDTYSTEYIDPADTPDLSDETKAHLTELDEGTEAILDEIDNLLEENAEEFVKSYVQKGGQ